MKVELLSHTPSRELLEALPISEVSENEFLRHLSFTFAIERISRACSHQLVRHRIASFSQQSQRYIQVKTLGEHIVTPPTVKEKGHSQYDHFISEASNTYASLVDAGVPREDARFVLPNAAETSLLMTIDGASLMHFFGLRLCSRAQWEIRALSEEMLKQVKKAEPTLFENTGPYCVRLGKCPEGRFSCGRIAEMKTKYT